MQLHMVLATVSIVVLVVVSVCAKQLSWMLKKATHVSKVFFHAENCMVINLLKNYVWLKQPFGKKTSYVQVQSNI